MGPSGPYQSLILESPDPFELCGSIEAGRFFQLKDGISFLLEGRAKTSLLQSNAHLSQDLLPPPVLITRLIMTHCWSWGT